MPTIALVDDDRNILTSVSIALEAEGYRVMTYSDGVSALDDFKTSPPHVAVLAAAAAGTRQGGTAAFDHQGRRQSQGSRRQGARARPLAHGPGAPHVHL